MNLGRFGQLLSTQGSRYARPGDRQRAMNNLLQGFNKDDYNQGLLNLRQQQLAQSGETNALRRQKLQMELDQLEQINAWQQGGAPPGQTVPGITQPPKGSVQGPQLTLQQIQYIQELKRTAETHPVYKTRMAAQGKLTAIQMKLQEQAMKERDYSHKVENDALSQSLKPTYGTPTTSGGVERRYNRRTNQWEVVGRGTDVQSQAAITQQSNKARAGRFTEIRSHGGQEYEYTYSRDVLGNQEVVNIRPLVEAGTYVAPSESGPPKVLAKPGSSKSMENPKNWTADMRKASGFTNRMLMGEQNIDSVLKSPEAGSAWYEGKFDITDASIAAIVEGGTMPLGIDEYFRRKDLTDAEQRYAQAAMDWIRAKLRKESGAVISDTEMSGEYSTYFPKPGDSDGVIAQKRAARMQALRNMQHEASQAWQPDAAMGIPQITSDEDFAKVPPGALFIDDDGKVYRKK